MIVNKLKFEKDGRREGLGGIGMATEKSTKSYTIDMCEGSILKKLLLFAMPLIASSILQLFFNAADVIVVGKFAGDHALAAVGSNGSIINLLTNVDRKSVV